MINACESFFLRPHDPHKQAIVFFEGLKSLHDKDKSITFAELIKLSIYVQHSLKKYDLKEGDFILLFEEPSVKLYATILAILASGYKVLLVEPWLSIHHIDRLIENCKPKLFVTKGIGKIWGLRSQSIRKIKHKVSTKKLCSGIEHFSSAHKMEIVKVAPETEAILTFTSGTSGTPKGVVRSHQYLKDSGDVVQKYLNYTNYPGMDLTIFTNLVLVNLSAGKGSLIVPSSWPLKSLRALDSLPPENAVDTLACGPAFLKKLMENSKCKTLRSIHVGGALTDCEIFEKAFLHWPEAHFDHVYGSSEAEPVAVIDAKIAVKKSREKNYFQCLYLGEQIPEITLEALPDQLWITGIHVSKKYLYDEEANRKNKKTDQNGQVWHNMGDRIVLDEAGLWYQGRDFQTLEEFKLEQKIYQSLDSSQAMVLKKNNEFYLIADCQLKDKIEKTSFPEIAKIFYSPIYRDKRHRARIDRVKTRQKVKL